MKRARLATLWMAAVLPFAVGCTMFRIVSGRSPHEGATELELMVKMAMEPAPPVNKVISETFRIGQTGFPACLHRRRLCSPDSDPR